MPIDYRSAEWLAYQISKRYSTARWRAEKVGPDRPEVVAALADADVLWGLVRHILSVFRAGLLDAAQAKQLLGPLHGIIADIAWERIPDPPQ